MTLTSKFISTMTAAAAAAAAAVTMAAPPQAADPTRLSSGGMSYAWYDDSTDRLVVCDMVSNDGAGATAWLYGSGTSWWGGRTAYNGCESTGGIPDGQTMRVKVCDFVWVPAYQQRVHSGCREQWFTS